MKIATVSCSNGSSIWGKSWPDWLADLMDKELLRAASPGAGNSFYIEKVHEIVKNYDVDLIIIQLTEPCRITLGLSTLEDNTTDLNDGGRFNSLGCYTWNINNNEENIKNITKKEVKIDIFWFEEVSTSNWVMYKINQDILTIYSLCKKFGKKCIFWSWFLPMENIFQIEYNWLKDEILWVPGHGKRFLEINNIDTIPNNYHYGSNAHKRLTEEWLLPEIKKLLDIQ